MADPTFIEVLQWNDQQCRDYLEGKRWPNGPICPKCGASEHWTINRKSKTKNKITKLYRCKSCRKDYTATVGTIFEDTKLPLNIWFAAIHQMCSSKKGVSANQIHRELKIDLKSAWYLCHRVREAMRDRDGSPLQGIVEADETYVGGKPRGHDQHRLCLGQRVLYCLQRGRDPLAKVSLNVRAITVAGWTVRAAKLSPSTPGGNVTVRFDESSVVRIKLRP